MERRVLVDLRIPGVRSGPLAGDVADRPLRIPPLVRVGALRARASAMLAGLPVARRLLEPVVLLSLGQRVELVSAQPERGGYLEMSPELRMPLEYRVPFGSTPSALFSM